MPKQSSSSIPAWAESKPIIRAAVFCAALWGWGCDPAPVASADTDPDSEIVIRSPAGGENYRIGEILAVKWALKGKGIEEINSVTIELSPDSGLTWIDLPGRSISTEDPAWGEYHWSVRAEVTHLGKSYPLASSRSLMRIKQYSTSDPAKITITRKPFAILAGATVSIAAPGRD